MAGGLVRKRVPLSAALHLIGGVRAFRPAASTGGASGFLKTGAPSGLLRVSRLCGALPVVPRHQGELVTVVLRSRPRERKDSGAHMS